MKKYVKSGIRFNGEAWEFDDRRNEIDDIVDLVEPQLYQSTLNNYTYWFGYKFNDAISSKVRSEFIADLKGYGDHPLTDYQIRRFIERPLGELNKVVNLYSLDCIVYPVSSRSTLVGQIKNCLFGYTSRKTFKKSFEFVKSAPTDITFDWDLFEATYGGLDDPSTYRNMKKYVQETLLPAIHGLDYFSIAQSVKSKYRPYIQNFLNFKNADQLEEYSKLQGDNILVVDDINTTGSTLKEILRILNEINNSCNIFVYLLLGRE